MERTIFGFSSEFTKFWKYGSPYLAVIWKRRSVFLALPGKLGDVVGWYRKGEDAPLGIAGGHHFDVGAIDHVHLRLKIAVGEGHGLAADDGPLLA